MQDGGAGRKPTITLQQTENGRVSVRFSYSQELVDLTKQLPESKWDNRVWSVAMSMEEAARYYTDYEFLVQTWQDLRRKLGGKEVQISWQLL